jgi:hypothetical protein
MPEAGIFPLVIKIKEVSGFFSATSISGIPLNKIKQIDVYVLF